MGGLTREWETPKLARGDTPKQVAHLCVFIFLFGTAKAKSVILPDC